MDADLLPNRAGTAEQKRRALERRIEALEAALWRLLQHCEARPTGETDFERDVIAAQKLLSESGGVER